MNLKVVTTEHLQDHSHDDDGDIIVIPANQGKPGKKANLIAQNSKANVAETDPHLSSELDTISASHINNEKHVYKLSFSQCENSNGSLKQQQLDQSNRSQVPQAY